MIMPSRTPSHASTVYSFHPYYLLSGRKYEVVSYARDSHIHLYLHTMESCYIQVMSATVYRSVLICLVSSTSLLHTHSVGVLTFLHTLAVSP